MANQFTETLGLRRNLVLLLAAIVLVGAGEEMWVRFVPKYLDTLGAGVFVIGLYDGLKTALAAVYAYPGGVIADRWGHRRAFVTFSLVSVAGYVVMLSASHWAAVIGGMVLFIAYANLGQPAMFSLVASSLPASKMVMGIGVQSLVKRVPIIVGPIAGGWLLDRFGVKDGVRIGVVASIVLTGISALLQGRIKDGTPSGINLSFGETLRAFDPRLKRLLASDVLVRFCERIPAAWLVIYAMDHVHVSATQVGLLTAMEMATAIVCYLPVAHFADRRGKEPFVVVTFVFFTLFPLALWIAGSFWMLALAFVIRGLKEFGDPSRKALIVTYAPPHAKAQTVGAYYLIRDLAVSTGAIVGGLAWRAAPEVNFLVAAGVGAMGTLYYIAGQRRGIIG